MNNGLKTVDDYIKSQPKDVAERLQVIRAEIKKLVPDAQEKLSYGMPYYDLNGRLLYFAAFKHHIGFYPMKTAITYFESELKNYQTSAGTIQLPHDQPLPVQLLRKIILYRAEQNRNK